jgi:hypothetical protein
MSQVELMEALRDWRIVEAMEPWEIKAKLDRVVARMAEREVTRAEVVELALVLRCVVMRAERSALPRAGCGRVAGVARRKAVRQPTSERKRRKPLIGLVKETTPGVFVDTEGQPTCETENVERPRTDRTRIRKCARAVRSWIGSICKRR